MYAARAESEAGGGSREVDGMGADSAAVVAAFPRGRLRGGALSIGLYKFSDGLAGREWQSSSLRLYFLRRPHIPACRSLRGRQELHDVSTDSCV